MFLVFKSKLALSASIIAAAAGFPVFFYSRSGFDRTTSGGGVDSALSNQSYSVNGKDLTLRSPGIPGVQLQQGINTKAYHILQGDALVSFDSARVGLDLTNTNNYSFSQDFSQEIEKEQKVVKVGKDQRKFYDTEAKKIANIQANFQTAKKKVINYEKNTEKISLTREERRALLKVFEGFYNLDQKRNILSAQLKEASNDDLKSGLLILDEGIKRKVKRDLGKINWGEVEIKVKKSGEGERNLSNFYGWQTFEQSPFQQFYENSELILSEIRRYEDSLSKQQKKASRERNSCRFSSNGFGGKRSSHIDSCRPNIQEYKQVAQKSKDAIEMHIAKWLLEKMGQFPSSQLEQK